jgi:hypothetical protein
MIMPRFHKVFIWVAIGGFAIFFATCKKENATYQSTFTVFNAVPGNTAFELLVNGAKLPEVYRYGAPATEQLMPSFTGSFGWSKAGISVADSTYKTDFSNESSYTLVFYDSLAKYKTYLVRDIFFDEASKNKCGIRLFAATINATNLTITNDTGRVLLGNRKFANFSGQIENAFSEIDTSSSTVLRLYHNSSLLDSVSGVKLEPGRSYSCFTSGILNGNGAFRPRLFLQLH